MQGKATMEKVNANKNGMDAMESRRFELMDFHVSQGKYTYCFRCDFCYSLSKPKTNQLNGGWKFHTEKYLSVYAALYTRVTVLLRFLFQYFLNF